MRGSSRVVGLGLAAVAGVLATSCSALGGSGPERVTAPGVEEELASDTVAGETAAPAPTPVGDPVVGDAVPVGDAGGNVAVLAVEEDVNAGALFSAGRGKEYFAALVKGCSGPTEKGLMFEPGYFILEMDGSTFADAGLPIKRPALDGGEVPAGGCLEGWVTFTVPEDAEAAYVIYDGSNRLKWQVPAEEPEGSGR